MSTTANAFALLTGVVILLMVLLVFAVLRFARAAKVARRRLREGDAERVFVAAAMQDALQTLKAQEQAMSARAHASEHLSEQIVASLTAGLLVVDAAGTAQILNPAGQRLLDAPDTALPVDYRRLLANAPPVAEVIERCIATGQPILRHMARIDRADQTTHLGVTVSPFGADAGRTGAICLFSDVTNVVELEEQLRLKATLARLGELTAGLAHEFRNGLATIHGYARLMDPKAVPKQYEPYVDGIRQETDSLQKIVTNFLNFARPEAVSFQPVDLHEVLQRASEDVLTSGGRHRCRLEVQGRFPTVPGDDVLLRQAFSNLLRNAVEACEGAGVPPQLTVTGSIDAAHDVANVAIDDNGPGIPPAQADKVFAPFFTTKPQGTGLGLALVQKIVVTHNGRVSVSRSPAGGARIQVVLPLQHAESPLT